MAARAAFLGGLLAETPETAGLTAFLSSMWLRGSHGRSAADFARSAESLAAEIDGFSGRSSIGLTLEVPSQRLTRALDLFAEVLGGNLEHPEAQHLLKRRAPHLLL